MDERSARTMFRQLADRDFEETGVDVEEAIRSGRRSRRRRTLTWVAAAAVLVIGGVAAVTIPTTRNDEKALPPAAPSSVKATGADLDPGRQRLRVGWTPDGTVGTTFDNGEDYQSVLFAREEKAGGGGGGPLLGYGMASVWLIENTSPLTFRNPDEPTVPGPAIHGVPSSWYEIKQGAAPGGSLTWTPAPGLRAVAIATSKELAARLAESVRVDLVTPVVLPFSLPRPKGLEVSGTGVTRYTNGHYAASVTVTKAGDRSQHPSQVTWWMANDTLAEHNGTLPTTLHGRPARLSEGPPENGVNVWLRLENGAMVGSLDMAQAGRYFRNRAEIITIVESITPVEKPDDHRYWTPDYLR